MNEPALLVLMMVSANHVPKYTKFDLPDDLVPVFLAELPVKSLLRFRCVSKSCNSVISDPEFSKLQHKPPCLWLYKKEEPFRFTIFNLSNSSTNCEGDSVDSPWTMSNYGYCRILHSCNGLICFCDYDNVLMIVANPSTRKFKHVEIDRTGLSCFGFGFDKSADYYKLVRAADTIGPSTGIPRTEFYALELKSNVWKKIQDIDWKIPHEDGVLLDGALHWIGYSWQDVQFSRPFVVVLDLATEKFKTILIPELDYRSSITLSTIGGLLCLSSKKSSKIDIWTMKEYGVTSSWSKLVTMPPEIVNRYGDHVEVTPVLFSGEDEIVAVINSRSHGDAAVRLNIKSLKFEEILRLKVSPFLISPGTIIIHRESLVSV